MVIEQSFNLNHQQESLPIKSFSLIMLARLSEQALFPNKTHFMRLLGKKTQQIYS